MGLNPPVPQQDSNWEIRIALLLSLLLQMILIFAGPMRKRTNSAVLRSAIWSCYLLADWVADLGLGLLLNNMGNIGGGGHSTSSFVLKRGGSDSCTCSNDGSGGPSPFIFAFWTPFLLLHLGGPDTITAYSVEDNELWNRHLIGLLFELFSATVIISCSLRGNPLIPATILMFTAGIIKYGERTYSLYSGSIERLRDSILGPPHPGPNYAKLMNAFNDKEKAGLPVEIAIANGEAEQAQMEAEMQETTRMVRSLGRKSVEEQAYMLFRTMQPIFVDLTLSYKQRRLSQAFFLERAFLKASEAFEVIKVELNFIYDMVYTKAPIANTKIGWILRSACSICLVSALVIFFFLDKGGIKRIDVGITYALLLGGLALDAAALLMLLFSIRMAVFLEQSRWFKWLGRLLAMVTKRWRPRRWSGRTSQMNLISYCLNKPVDNSRWWLKVAGWLRIEEIIDDFFFIRRVPLSKHSIKEGPYNTDTGENRLLKFIFDGLKEAAAAPELTKREGINKFCNSRGERVLERHWADIKMALGDDDKKLAVIMDSVKEREFDEALLLWHIATDLCLSDEDQRQGPVMEDTLWRQLVSETLSEYMLYLLIMQPDMLSAAGIRLRPYRDTCAEARRFFPSVAPLTTSHDDARRMLLGVNTSINPALVKGDRSNSVLFDACILAKALMYLDGGGHRWEVISAVWGEMLVFAATKCRGSTHVRKLNRGGELITLVWLFMAHFGLGDMYQKAEDAKAKLIVIDQ